MAQAIAVVRDNDAWQTTGIPVDNGVAYTPTANALVVLTAVFFNSTSAYDATNHAALIADGWTEKFDSGAGTRSRAYVFEKKFGASPAQFSATISNNDATRGTAFTLVEITGNVTGLGVSVSAGSSGTYNQIYSATMPAYATPANSTYVMVAGPGVVPFGSFIDGSAGLVYQPHVYNSGASGSSNQHWFLSGSDLSTITYEEAGSSDGTGETIFVAFEVLGEIGGTPVLSAPTSSAPSVGGVTLGGSTNEASGTAYFIVAALAADLVGITAAQIKAGTDAQGDVAIIAGSGAVSASPFTQALTGTLSLSTSYVYALVQNANAQDSNIITGTFATAGATNNGFRLPLVDPASVTSPNETGLTAALFSDQAAGTQLGASFTSATIDGGNCVVSNDQFGASPTLGSTYFMRLYRPSPTLNEDNRDRIFEVICVDLDTLDNSLDG